MDKIRSFKCLPILAQRVVAVAAWCVLGIEEVPSIPMAIPTPIRSVSRHHHHARCHRHRALLKNLSDPPLGRRATIHISR